MGKEGKGRVGKGWEGREGRGERARKREDRVIKKGKFWKRKEK